MTDFLITTEPGEHHRLLISRTEGSTNPLIYISTNHRTMGMSPAMAEELLRGLMAVLKGGFSRAISETSLRMEQEAAERRTRPHPPALPQSGSGNPTPTLESL